MSRKARRTLSKNLESSYYRAAIYCRLSKEDELSGESASVKNQKGMLTEYCQANGWEIIATFADDGYTGLNQDRLGFQKLLKACEDGLVKAYGAYGACHQWSGKGKKISQPQGQRNSWS